MCVAGLGSLLFVVCCLLFVCCLLVVCAVHECVVCVCACGVEWCAWSVCACRGGERVVVVVWLIWCWTSSWSYGVMVSTLDFESSDPGSNPGRTSFLVRGWGHRRRVFVRARVSLCCAAYCICICVSREVVRSCGERVAPERYRGK